MIWWYHYFWKHPFQDFFWCKEWRWMWFFFLTGKSFERKKFLSPIGRSSLWPEATDFNPSEGGLKSCLDVPTWKLGSMVRISGLFHPNSSPIYKDRWNNPLIRSPLIRSQTRPRRHPSWWFFVKVDLGWNWQRILEIRILILPTRCFCLNPYPISYSKNHVLDYIFIIGAWVFLLDLCYPRLHLVWFHPWFWELYSGRTMLEAVDVFADHDQHPCVTKTYGCFQK